METEAIEPGIEIRGHIVYSTVAAFPMSRCIPARILFNKGIGTRVNKKFKIDANEWCQRNDWLEVLMDMSSRFGDDVLARIGMKIPEMVPLPEWVKDLDSAVKYGETIYQKNLRKNGRIIDPNSNVSQEEISHYSYSRNGNEYTIVSRSPYPCAFVKGLLTAIVQNFEPNAVIIHDNSTSCCKRGDESCTYKIRW